MGKSDYCVIHPRNQANKHCSVCEKGYCKHCRLFRENGEDYCEDHKPVLNKRTIRMS